MGIVLFTFVLISGIVFGTYWLLLVRPERRQQVLLRQRLRGTATTGPAAGKAIGDLERPEQRLSHVKALDVVLSRAAGLSGPLERLITQSGLKMSVGTLVLSSALLTLVTFVLVEWLTYSALFALALAPLVGMIPYLYVRHARTKRFDKFEEQFPEAIELLARALRAGHAFPTGLLMVADEMPPPIGGEFKLLYDRQNFGMPFPEALRGLAERVPLLDARFFVTAVMTQRETGGNLSEVLDNLATVIRDRFKVKRQVRVVTAHGRITGWILSAMPPSLAAVLFVVSPDHMNLLISDPLGIKMIGVALFFQVMGTLIIRKLVNVPY
ncbi:MAG TPA: type II secretion system F family protein [Vicinamibacterales bacterium]|nr:type II secretion system F family protein [Vicinamibacterales bacterium]